MVQMVFPGRNVFNQFDSCPVNLSIEARWLILLAGNSQMSFCYLSFRNMGCNSL